jgi:hypothetical protein
MVSALRLDATPLWARYFARRTQATLGRALLAGLEQPLAEVLLVIGRRIEAGWIG